MKKSNKVLIGSLAVVIMSALAVSSAMAYQGDYSKQGPAYSPERHTAMIEAMNNNDYQAWSELMADRGRVTQVINEDNFSRFVEAHQLAHSGDLEGADTIRKELGLRARDGERVGAGYGKGQGQNKGEKRGGGRINNENHQNYRRDSAHPGIRIDCIVCRITNN